MQINQAEHAFLSAIGNLPQKKLDILKNNQVGATVNADDYSELFVTLPGDISDMMPDFNAQLNSSIINSINSWIFNTTQDEDLVARTRQAWGFNDRDNVNILVVPAGQNRIPPMSFVTRPTSSPRSMELQREITRSMGSISELELGLGDPSLTEEERARMIGQLQQEMSAARRNLNNEMSRLRNNAPRSGFVVVQRPE